MTAVMNQKESSSARVCDLHTHSTYSDGTLSPTQLIRMAEEDGLKAVVLSDHNTVDGLQEFLEQGSGSPVECIPAVEFSTDYGNTELHMLGMFIRPEHFGQVREYLQQALQRKEQSNIDLVKRLNAAGLPVDYESVKATTPNGQVNRAVIAAELVRLGYCQSVQEAFSRWLNLKCGLYVPPARPDVFEVIALIRSMGAVAVLAHPFLNLNEDELRLFLPRAKERGLDGMEVSYPLFSEEQTCLAGEMARKFSLLPSGGSDFHGANKPHITLGDCAVPEPWLEELKATARKRQQETEVRT